MSDMSKEYPSAEAIESAAQNILKNLFTIERRDVLASKVVDALNGSPSAASVISLAASHESEMASFAWVNIKKDKSLDLDARMDAFALTVIQEAARLSGKVALSKERVAEILSGAVGAPISDNEFGALVTHWTDRSNFTFSGMGMRPAVAERFEIALEVMSKPQLVSEADFAKQAQALAIAGEEARATQARRPKMG